jgi:hypothetical protein
MVSGGTVLSTAAIWLHLHNRLLLGLQWGKEALPLAEKLAIPLVWRPPDTLRPPCIITAARCRRSRRWPMSS